MDLECTSPPELEQTKKLFLMVTLGLPALILPGAAQREQTNVFVSQSYPERGLTTV